MIFALINNIIVIIMALLGIFFSEHPAVCLILAGLIMVVLTYTAISGEYDADALAAGTEDDQLSARKSLIFADMRNGFGAAEVVKLLLVVCFASAFGCFAGFFMFAVFDRVRPWVAALTATLLYLVLYISGVVKDDPFIHAVLGRNSAAGKGGESALVILLGISVFIIVAVFLSIKGALRKQLKRKAIERLRIRNSNINEMHEKRLNQELTKQNYLIDRNARLVERENISRNIHNSVGHSITAAIMTLDAADMLYDVKPDEARKRMNDANERIRGSLESIRRAVRTLDDETGTMPVSDLRAAMDGIIDDFVMDTEYHVSRIYDVPAEELQIPHEHAEFLTGVLEELLTNGVKHGSATEFAVILTGDSAHIKLEVKDNGRSDFGEENSRARIEKGFGVKKMISYAERCGGKTGFVNDDGFRAFVELPV